MAKDRRLPEGIRRKRGGYEIYYRVDGSLRFESAGLTTLRKAEARLRLRKQEAKSGQLDSDFSSRMTLAEYFEAWAEARIGKIRSAKDDINRLKHATAIIGKRKLEDVDVRDMLRLLEALPERQAMRGGKLSKMTIFHVYTAVNGALNDAEQRRLIERNPCKDLRRAQKPKRPKRSEVQRGYFTKEHVELLISDPGISEIDRLFYALLFLTGTRSSEAIGLCFEDWNREAEPLGRIHLRRQWHDQLREYAPLKGKPDCPGPPRDVPVHPTLAKMLSEWKLSGFEKYFGRKPKPEDPIIPSVRGAAHRRTLRNSLKHLQADCERLDVRPVGGVSDAITQHQSRNSFITLAAAHGAPEAWIKRITHNASGDVLAGYMVNDWDAMCRVVECIPVQVQTYGEVIAMPRAVGGNTSNRGTETDGTSAPGHDRVGLLLASSRIATKKPLITEAHLRSGRDSNPRPPA